MALTRQLAFVCLALSVFIAVPAHAKKARYPANFLWGAALSAHQTEGAFDGGENADWYGFEHPVITPSPIKNGDTADVAVDFWHRYNEDIQNAKKIGLNTLRTSIAWEKIEPQKGVFNQAVIDHYHEIFKAMRDAGIRPVVCLHHFTSPTWFDKGGGWTNPQSPQEFADYAKYVVSHLYDIVDLWMTFNEPMILIEMGYLKGEVPPQKIGLSPAFEAAYNTARAFRIVSYMIHQIQGVPDNSKKNELKGVGIAYAFGFFDPVDPKNPQDVQAAENLTDLSDWAWLRGAETGHLEFRLKIPGKQDQVWQRDLPAGDLPADSGPVFDWMGINYYQRYLIKYSGGIIPFKWITPDGPTGDNGWSIYPLGLERLIRSVAQRFSYPLMVTENGLADAADTKRPQHIRDHLHYLDRAMSGSELGGPIDVRGFYEWSLMDNFEWTSGYSMKFGLYEIQFNNGLARVARPSAGVYASEIQKRSTRRRWWRW
jgi:beta-glucosidase